MSAEPILQAMQRDLYDGVPMDEVRKSLVLAARALIEQDPGYSYVTARLLLHTLRLRDAGRGSRRRRTCTRATRDYLPEFIRTGIEAELLDERLADYDLKCLGAALDANRDLKFTYLGLQILYDRYFLHVRGRRIELPQIFFMRVAMGLALNEPEDQREARAIEFYNVLSLVRFHELDADAVQLRHAPLAARELLPDHRVRRPRRHLRSDQGKRAAAEIRRRHRQRLDAGARARRPHQGHQRQDRRAWCPSSRW